MRIEIDEETERELDQVRRGNYIYGKGHANTVTFLLRHYKDHQALEKVVGEAQEKLREDIERTVRQVLRDLFINLLNPRERR